MNSIGTGWLWGSFISFVLIVLMMDIVLLNLKKGQSISIKSALIWTTIWVLCALIFAALLWWYLSQAFNVTIANQKVLEFLTGYIIEESLSIDNMFAFLMVFNFFAIPPHYQRRVLLYGVLGAIVMRLIMIVFGTWLIIKLHWIIYLFGLFLVIMGIKMIIKEEKKDLSDNALLAWLRRHFRVTHELHQERFFIRKNALWYATPLFLALVLIELTDLIFALDSIPAVIAITQDPFIIFTSNIFAILGLRALYFGLAHMADRFYLLKYGVAVLLIFVGLKMLMEPWVNISVGVSLIIVLAILSLSMLLSVLIYKEKT